MKKKINKYSNYSKKTQTFMDAVENYIVNKYGDIEPQWEGMLEMLALNYDMFQKCGKEIEKSGLMIENRFGNFIKNPLLKAQSDAQTQALRIIKEFGISPYGAGKIKDVESNDDNNFIESLLDG